MLGNALTIPDFGWREGTGTAYPVCRLESLVFLGITITLKHRAGFYVWGTYCRFFCNPLIPLQAFLFTTGAV